MAELTISTVILTSRGVRTYKGLLLLFYL